MPRVITAELALRLRRDRGLMLPIEDVRYTNPEIAHIAKRQAEIQTEMQELDKRLVTIALLEHR